MANTYAPLLPVVPSSGPMTSRRCLMSIEWGNLCRMPNMIFGEFIFYSAVHRGQPLCTTSYQHSAFSKNKKLTADS